jgi:hypothetical protein
MIADLRGKIAAALRRRFGESVEVSEAASWKRELFDRASVRMLASPAVDKILAAMREDPEEAGRLLAAAFDDAINAELAQ